MYLSMTSTPATGSKSPRYCGGDAGQRRYKAAAVHDVSTIVSHGVPSHLSQDRVGSKASRKPSPTRLKANTVSAIASPGKIDIQGAVSRKVRPSLSMVPHDGAGGCVPNPM